jgi:hypothetical protein
MRVFFIEKYSKVKHRAPDRTFGTPGQPPNQEVGCIAPDSALLGKGI